MTPKDVPDMSAEQQLADDEREALSIVIGLAERHAWEFLHPPRLPQPEIVMPHDLEEAERITERLRTDRRNRLAEVRYFNDAINKVRTKFGFER